MEKFQGIMYSSCLILDGGIKCNIRKRIPFRGEKDYINGWNKELQYIPLSIGKSYFFICNDVAVDLEKYKKMLLRIYF